MTSVSESIWIDTPVETAFEYLDDPYNHAEVTPSVTNVQNVDRLDNGGKRLDCTYTMAGVGLQTELKQTVHEPNRRMVFDMYSGIDGELDLEFTTVNGGTEVTYRAKYQIPSRVLSAVVKPFARRYNERELRTALENLKQRLELEGESEE
ncbi:SRPBCC family protein [Halohasta salina]|uniref:SRPBCC family protein n=1 Tax=Halohasta salina TaxID=2961621 RepID=UPI0020A4E1BB|nr:SRPBCC family protein [Halohasta salina]